MDSDGNGLNINADTAAFQVAARLQASALVFLSDTRGVISDGSVLQALSLAGGVTDRGSTNRVRVVRIVDGRIVEIITYGPESFEQFGSPLALDD
jgi:protein involved in polysaccharide export with SLBB domain